MLGKKLVAVIVCLHITICAVYAKKSVFIISNHSSSHAQAYRIEGSQVDFQADVDISTLNPGYGAVGNAIWPEKNLMFVNYENSGMIVWASTKTLEKEGEDETYLGNLAGIVVDETRDLIYVMSRQSSYLYVYSFDEIENTLVQEGEWYLNPTQDHYISGMGIALDETKNLLYVTSSGDYRVHIYDTNDLVGSGGDVDPNRYIDIVVGENYRPAVGIAVDPVKRCMYTGDIWGHNYLVRTNIDTNSSIEVEVTGDWYSGNATGLGVDDETGLVFCTTTLNDFRVYDSNLVLKDTEANNISGPAGVAVGGWYKTSSFYFVKDNNDPNNGCVDPNIHKNLTFDILWDINGHSDTNIVIIDQLPDEIDYNSSSPVGDYNDYDRTVKWTISGSSGHIVLKTNVNNWAAPGAIIINTAIMEGDTYRNETSCQVSICNWDGSIIYVDKDAVGFNNGTNWDDAYTDLQDAIAAARDLSPFVTAIWVAAGTYKPVNDINLSGYQNKSFELPDNVALIGHFGGVGTYETSPDQRVLFNPAYETILEGKIGQEYWEAVNYIVKGQSINNAMVDGFTIQGASNSGIYIDNSDVSILNCKIKINQYYGIRSENFSYPDIYNCTFINNSSRDLTIYNHCWPEISSCIFDGNALTYYGIYIENLSFVSVSNTSFKRHTSSGIYGNSSTLTLNSSSFDDESYGLYLSYDATSTMIDCSINNSVNNGIYIYNSDLTADRCIIERSGRSGMLLGYGCNLSLQNSIIRHCGNNGLELSDNLATTIKNNWIHNNGTVGISFTNQVSTPLVRNNTIYDNHTYGIWSSQQGADPNVINCIISGNDTNDLYRESGSFNKVNYCLLQHAHSGNGNITGSPGFLNPTDPNDLHIADTSQCKNAGDPDGIYENETDIDGETRIAYERVDIGADEFYWSRADYNIDGIVNFPDFALFGSPWRNQDPNITLDADSDVDIDDLKLFCNEWLWEFGGCNSQWMAMAGGDGTDISMAEETLTIEIAEETASGLMLPDVKSSMATRPARLRNRTDKFCNITAAAVISTPIVDIGISNEKNESSEQVSETTVVEQSLATEEMPEEEPVPYEELIPELLEWVDQLWQSGEFGGSEEDYLELRRIIQEVPE
ncbi:MAG: right-handed parallel beta-helix repeat-containing protein [Planctomycetota bacterium]